MIKTNGNKGSYREFGLFSLINEGVKTVFRRFAITELVVLLASQHIYLYVRYCGAGGVLSSQLPCGSATRAPALLIGSKDVGNCCVYAPFLPLKASASLTPRR